MHVGRRVAKLREAHGESLREAAARTGVSHTTIARIEKGEVTGSFQSTLRKISEGYGVRIEFLLNGRDPRQDFDFSLHRLSAEDRSKLYFVPARTRIRMVLDFLLAEYQGEFSVEQLSRAAGIAPEAFWAAVDGTGDHLCREPADQRIAEALSRTTGIPQRWFLIGSMEPEPSETMPSDTVGAFVDLMRKAAQAGIQPDVLDMAIELLILKGKEGSPRYTS